VSPKIYGPPGKKEEETMHRPYKTTEEINRLIPRLETIIANLRVLKREIQQKTASVQAAKMSLAKAHALRDDSFFAEEAEIEFLLMDANAWIKQIETLGGELKDIDHGLIDFYGMVNGEPVYLCWKSGEPALKWYHGLDEGFRGRKPL
jgi:hypothetical protein